MPAHPTPEVAFHAEELPSAPTNVACHSDLIASVAVQFAPCLDEAPFVALNISVPRRPVPIIPHEPAAPALQRPLDIPDAFLTSHTLAAGETLGDLARRYDLPLATLIWANYLDRGDALIVGQTLRIPRTPGLSHRVAPGETLNQLAERFAIAPEAIATFPPNAIGDDLRLIPGSEIFVPAGTRPLPQEWLAAKGDWEGLARWGPEPAGVVRAPQTNLRNGPSTEHVRVIQLEAGRQLALKARYQDWLLVVIGTNQGWVRQDLLHLDPEVVAALPESNDFPPPPPRWVWPAYGRLTSGFGPRWGGFHDGIDIASRAWSPILAARSGRVSEAGWCRGYGYCVKLQHGGGVMTTYGHLITTPLVRVGDDVDAGQLIGHMGSTYDRAGGGFSTGIHLHFSIKINGRAVDPLRFLP
ncbi:MAG: LysM peptidoglycan-binding domain-containing protein [Candidatus Viridilinea halotolerans]|uniref:LysM peptidoglycan-binding domain-containing protein n=1 Tax=Candidatus Viridilinea halotolerans TaxID=2491704 RepID=A0A426TRJ6_9CHLR|nr:MAG: LysM peptidoglycan-binding domain-containing protein [Candidatus Viridilinea halotolerans]